MKVLLTSFCFLFVFSLSAQEQDTIPETERLAGLSQVWGFLKYHHVSLTEGELDWDEVLVNTIPKVKKAHFSDDYTKVLQGLIKKAGPYASCSYCKPAPSEHETDLQWLENDLLFQRKITLELKSIRNSRRGTEAHYAFWDEENYTLSFKKEKAYEDMIFPKEEWRLLALFRLWNAVHYYFPYKSLADEDWYAAQKRFIPRMQECKSAAQYNLLFLEIISSLNDSNAYISSKAVIDFFGNFNLPFTTAYVEGQTIISRLSYALDDTSNLKIGDRLLEINGLDVAQSRKMLSKYISASNEASFQRNLNYTLSSSRIERTPIQLENEYGPYLNNVSCYTQTELRAKSRIQPSHKAWEVFDGNIGYINIGRISQISFKEGIDTLYKTKAIIFDARAYPSSDIFTPLHDYFFAAKTPYLYYKRPDALYPGIYRKDQIKTLGPELKNPATYKGKIIVLVNERTQGPAEDFALALQELPQTQVLGSMTAGANGRTSDLKLPGGILAIFTTVPVYSPDGTSIQRKGISPDISQETSIKAIRERKDESLEKALQILR